MLKYYRVNANPIYLYAFVGCDKSVLLYFLFLLLNSRLKGSTCNFSCCLQLPPLKSPSLKVKHIEKYNEFCNTIHVDEQCEHSLVFRPSNKKVNFGRLYVTNLFFWWIIVFVYSF